MLLCCFYHVRGSAIMPSLLSFAGPLGWWGYISLFFCLFVDECFFFFFFWWVCGDPQGDWGAHIFSSSSFFFFFCIYFLVLILNTLSLFVSVRSLSASVCLFVCLTHPTLRHSFVLKGADQEKESAEEGGKEKKQKKKKLVVVYFTAIITMAVFHCRHWASSSSIHDNRCRNNDGIKHKHRR